MRFEVDRRQSPAAHTAQMGDLLLSFEAPMIEFRRLPPPGGAAPPLAHDGKGRLAWEECLVLQELHSDVLGWLGRARAGRRRRPRCVKQLYHSSVCALPGVGRGVVRSHTDSIVEAGAQPRTVTGQLLFP